MKCPKCGYLSFDDAERCRNCGYELSLALDAPPVVAVELPLQEAGERAGSLPDLARLDAGRRAGEERPLPPGSAPQDAILRTDTSQAREPDGAPGADLPLDLPLFAGAASRAETIPLVTWPRPPRSPLSVRRATPETPRARSLTPRVRQEPVLDLGVPAPETGVEPAADGPATAWMEPAGPARRAGAVLIDLGLLVASDAAVVYFTLKLCGLTVQEMHLLPAAPLVGFFGLLNGGYFVAFTATCGQTIGKMATGIRVVGTREPAVRVGMAVLRTLAYLVSALPLGLGFLAGLIGRERRTFHDRLAETRVVKVS